MPSPSLGLTGDLLGALPALPFTPLCEPLLRFLAFGLAGELERGCGTGVCRGSALAEASWLRVMRMEMKASRVWCTPMAVEAR